MIHIQHHSDNPGFVTVIFELPAQLWADKVSLAGDFNNWNKRNLPFRHDRDGCWRLRILMVTGHCYQFCYVVDDAWFCEPSTASTSALVPNVGHRIVSLLDTSLPQKMLVA